MNDLLYIILLIDLPLPRFHSCLAGMFLLFNCSLLSSASWLCGMGVLLVLFGSCLAGVVCQRLDVITRCSGVACPVVQLVSLPFAAPVLFSLRASPLFCLGDVLGVLLLRFA
jgi:hypothetical protein